MNYYTLRIQQPHQHHLGVELQLRIAEEHEKIELQLPAWRPGRYELGNFARKLVGMQISTLQGKVLPFRKIAKDRWKCDTCGAKEFLIKYHIVADEINAGSTYCDDKLFYINPVNCLVYVEGYQQNACILHLDIPENWQVASSLHRAETEKPHYYQAVHYDQLADSPLLAAPALSHFSYETEGQEFHVWFHGLDISSENPDAWEQLKSQFKAFSQVQLQCMKTFPKGPYHFINIILPTPFYHGVEHLHSTVIVLGPEADFWKAAFQENLLGVSSHELFHVWNVKRIRPAALQPYDYTKECYSSMGFIYEGMTTYYGDLFLLRSGVFSWQQFVSTFDENLRKHFLNYGRKTISLADASVDTWLDGYLPNNIHRRVSIYTEGALTAFILDAKLRALSGHQFSLDDFMRGMDEQYGKTKIGYRKESVVKILTSLGLTNADDWYETYIERPIDLMPSLAEACQTLGLQLVPHSPLKPWEHAVGMIIDATHADKPIIMQVAPGSPAEKSGLARGDEIIAVQGLTYNAFSRQLAEHPLESYWITLRKGSLVRVMQLKPMSQTFYKSYGLQKMQDATPGQRQAFEAWSHQTF